MFSFTLPLRCLSTRRKNERAHFSSYSRIEAESQLQFCRFYREIRSEQMTLRDDDYLTSSTDSKNAAHRRDDVTVTSAAAVDAGIECRPELHWRPGHRAPLRCVKPTIRPAVNNFVIVRSMPCARSRPALRQNYHLVLYGSRLALFHTFPPRRR